ncbi:MAG TPA: serine hydrolase domain-containing protein [Hyphomicrobiaceae bacterium]|jgi:CubicO group peptidase (beta-lactamase class C family)|nr:serine hydrolase domain-containing protein [Hyphomicrobiaceae bacterium]
MRTKLAAATIVLGLLMSAAAGAEPLQTAAPESVGLSSERLGRITEFLRSDIAKGTIPGAVLLVSRHGKIAYFEAVGRLDPQADSKMGKDAIFRIYSMTKPIVTVAAMMLVEQGTLALGDPVAKYLPEFKDVKVGEEKRDADGKVTLDLVAPKRPMTIQDLMRHTSGLTYGFFGEGAVKKAYLEADLNAGDPTTAEFVGRLAKLPLVYQPGTTWEYSQSTDVLGRVIEVAAGKPLYQALKEMLLDPLGMVDTSFYATDPSKQKRLAEPFANDRTIGAGALVNDPRNVRKYESGGGGLVATAEDYARFLQMLLNGGALDGRRYLSPTTIAYMTSDHMGEVIRRGPYDLMGPGYKFGLGFAVRTDPGMAPTAGSAGDYYWGGAGGTYFWIDPKEKLFVVFMMQSPSKRVPYRPLIRNMVYAAIME